MEISKKIALARKKKGLTQEQLADLANVTVRTVQRIESGESTPRAFTIKNLADALETNFESLAIFNGGPNSYISNDSELLQNDDFDQDNEKHILKILCLSCFSYLVVPLVHFLIPIYFLKKSGSCNPKTITAGRAMIRQQIYWAALLSFLLLLTLAYNFIVATYFKGSYLIHYLWPFMGMYILNAFHIAYGLIRINTVYFEAKLKA